MQIGVAKHSLMVDRSYKMYSSVLIFTIAFIISCSGRNVNNDGFFQIGHKNYYISLIKTNFFAARDLCMQNNGDLVTFESISELDAVSDYLINNKEQLNGEIHFWTSYFDLGKANGMFYSIATGRPLMSSGWLHGQPNNWGNNQHCVNIWYENGKYGLDDHNCMAISRALCEETPQCDKSNNSVTSTVA